MSGNRIAPRTANRSTGPGIRIDIPGRKPLLLTHLITDFTGTLSKDGVLLPGVAGRLRRVARRLRIIVATADTFGTARTALRGLPVRVELVRTGPDKAALMREIGPRRVVAIGNGRNDVPMMKAAALGMAVIGPEGAFGGLPSVADVVFRDVNDALDALGAPWRLTATLRT